MDTTTFDRTDHAAVALLRPAALLAGPTALLSIGLLAVALVVSGGDDLAMAASPVAIASSAVGLVSLLLLLLAVLPLTAAVPVLREDAGTRAVAAALIGTALAAGGQWTMVFVLPGLAEAAPSVATSGLGSVIAGYVVSFIVLGAGWAWVAFVLRRAPGVGRGLRIALFVGAALCVTPCRCGSRWSPWLSPFWWRAPARRSPVPSRHRLCRSDARWVGPHPDVSRPRSGVDRQRR